MAPFFVQSCYGIYPMHLDTPWLAQLLGLLACAIGATAFLQHQDQKLRRHLTLNGVLLALHFMMLGATVAAINCLLVGLRIPPNVKRHVDLYCVGLGAGASSAGTSHAIAHPDGDHFEYLYPVQIGWTTTARVHAGQQSLLGGSQPLGWFDWRESVRGDVLRHQWLHHGFSLPAPRCSAARSGSITGSIEWMPDWASTHMMRLRSLGPQPQFEVKG